MDHVSRYVPARTNEGWGVALGIVLLAVACIVFATIVHKRTYRPPTDPMFQAAGDARH